jgi:hypothetical protein
LGSSATGGPDHTSFTTPSGRHLSPPVFPSALSAGDGTITVTFLDLIEIRFVDAFISAGVRWKTLRDAYARVAAALGSHPFSRGRFVTDGRAMFQEFARERSARSDHAFADVVTGQTIFGAALTPYLATLKFDNDDLAIEWWPLGKRRGTLTSRCY